VWWVPADRARFRQSMGEELEAAQELIRTLATHDPK